jgi:hypothetical protein
MLPDIGAPTHVDLKDGRGIDGWLRAEMPSGILVSLDKEGRDIRFIKRGDWHSYSLTY